MTYTEAAKIAAVTKGIRDERHVLGFMYAEGTLDHLSAADLMRLANESANCAVMAGPAESEQIALSYGV